MKFYIPPQVPRLALAFAVFISLFLLLRYLLTPDTFGEYGHYRGASLIDNASVEIHYAGQQACLDCHQDIEDIKKLDVHSEIHCESCHGPGQAHVLSGEAKDILKPTGREFCAKCHKMNAARPKNAVFQIEVDKHNSEKNCTECHNPHQPWKTIK
jgi:predicted CXXCH cytochrome family protein